MSDFISEAISAIWNNPLLLGIAASLIAAFIAWIVKCLVYARKESRPSIESSQHNEKNDGALSTVIGSDNIVSQTINYGSIPKKDDSLDDGFEKIDATRVVAQRLRDAIDLLNEDVCNEIDAIWIAKEVLGEESFASVQSYLNAELAPPFGFFESFSTFFGIDSKWLMFGRGNPFPLKYAFSSQDFKKQIESVNPEGIFFALDKSERRRAIIILKRNDYSYQVVGRSDWPLAIHDSRGQQNVGTTGLYGIGDFF